MKVLLKVFLVGIVIAVTVLMARMLPSAPSAASRMAPKAASDYAPEPEPEPIPDPESLPPGLAATPQAAQAAAQATIEAGRAVMVNAGLTATAVGLEMAQAQATQRALATEQAYHATSTAQVVTATAQALALHATATAQNVQLAATAQALVSQGTATAQVINAQATALAAEAERSQLAVEQQRMMNQVWAVTKWGLAVLFVLFAFYLLYRFTALRVVRRADGKVLIVAGGIVYDPDRNPNPVLRLGPQGAAAFPPISAEAQAQTTARDQAISLARALGGRRPPESVAAAFPLPPDPRQMIDVEILPPERILPWLREVEQKLPPPEESGV